MKPEIRPCLELTDLYKISYFTKSVYKEYGNVQKDQILSFVMIRNVKIVQKYARWFIKFRGENAALIQKQWRKVKKKI